MGIIFNKALLEGVDPVIAARPDRLRNQIVDADDEYVLVVGAIKDDTSPFAGDSTGESATGNRGPIPWP